ncbi:MAG: sulfur carrier protein ThiS [bacterium]|nr:sulfur carrier protein ThiS [bacterium]
MISIVVNGRRLELESGLSGLELLEQLDRNSHTLVIEHNGKIIPLLEFHQARVDDGDVLELVTLVGGG